MVSSCLPAGTVVHTCANINGLPWHASAPLTGDQNALTLWPSWQNGGGAQFDGTVPVVLRANDSACSRFTFNASIHAASSNTESYDAGSDDAGVNP
jgi:hypothetical protein